MSIARVGLLAEGWGWLRLPEHALRLGRFRIGLARLAVLGVIADEANECSHPLGEGIRRRA